MALPEVWQGRNVDQGAGLGLAAPAPPVPGAPAPSLPQPEIDYMQMFQSALGASRAGVERQFTMALGDIAQREGLAGQALGQLPGQLSTIYQQGAAGNAAATKSLDAAQKASGLQSFMGAGAQMAPLAAAQSNDLAARQADVPLLQLAVQTETNRQRGAVRQAQASAAAESQGQLASFYADMAAQQQGRRYDEADRTAARQAELEDMASERSYADRTRREDRSFELRMRRLDKSAADERDPETGLTFSEADSVRRSKDYKDALDGLKDTHKSKNRGVLGVGGLFGWKDESGSKPLTAEQLYNKYRHKPKVLKVLAQDIPELAAYIVNLGAE